jgi:hypothetical protein
MWVTIVKAYCDSGIAPKELDDQVPWRPVFFIAEGELDSEQFKVTCAGKKGADGNVFDPERYCCEDSELIRREGKTYAVYGRFGRRHSTVMKRWRAAFPDIKIIRGPMY